MSIEMENINLIKSIAQDIELIKKSLTSSSQKRWMTVKDLSEYLGYSKDRIYKIKEDFLVENHHFYKKTGKILFDRIAIDEWMCGRDSDEIVKSQRQIVDNVLSSLKTL
jgi:predicted DNA-binding transcriptional regulator AlpA